MALFDDADADRTGRWAEAHVDGGTLVLQSVSPDASTAWIRCERPADLEARQ